MKDCKREEDMAETISSIVLGGKAYEKNILFIHRMWNSCSIIFSSTENAFAATNGYSEDMAVAWANQRYYEHWGEDYYANNGL